MHTTSIKKWVHDHSFGQDRPKAGERRTWIVIAMTGIMMIGEIAAGLAFGSMALLADGLHMASHASALAVSAFAYAYTRRHAHDERFNFGTGKVNSLAAFSSAILLGVFALIMSWESLRRLLAPIKIGFDQALLVAVLGLVINGVSLWVLKGSDHHHQHGNEPDHTHTADHHDHDHNLKSAYLHVLADALTSVLAIFALLAGKFLGLNWMDPLMGILGAVLVVRWAWQLVRSAGRVLLDMRVPEDVTQEIRLRMEDGTDDRVTDLHVWAVGPGIYAGEIGLVSSSPQEPDHYRNRLPEDLSLVHVTIEVKRCGT